VKRRPAPIIAITVLYFGSAAAIILLIAIDYLLRIPLWSAPFLIVVAIVQSVVGWGFWRLRNWARLATVVLAGFFAVPSMMEVAEAFRILSTTKLIFHLALITFQGMVVAYLILPQTKRVFEEEPIQLSVSSGQSSK
jgi:hypothetical protein